MTEDNQIMVFTMIYNQKEKVSTNSVIIIPSHYSLILHRLPLYSINQIYLIIHIRSEVIALVSMLTDLQCSINCGIDEKCIQNAVANIALLYTCMICCKA